jgi:hypothetical protein
MLNITQDDTLDDTWNVINQAINFLNERQDNSTMEGVLRDQVLFAILEYAKQQFTRKIASSDRYDKYNALWNLADNDPCAFLLTAAQPNMRAENCFLSNHWNEMVYALARNNKAVIFFKKKTEGLFSCSVALMASGVFNYRLLLLGLMLFIYTNSLRVFSPDSLVLMPVTIAVVRGSDQLLANSLESFFASTKRVIGDTGHQPVTEPPRL